MTFRVEHETRPRLWWKYEQTIYVLESPQVFKHLDGNTYTIPAGFRSDGASIPWFLRWYYRQDGPWMKDAVKHDFLYDNKIGTRLMADVAFLLDMINNPKVDKATAEKFYSAVRIGGKSWWNN